MTATPTLACPSCGEENAARFRRCGQCGAVLEPDRPVEEIRRTVTVVTSDWKGSTSLGERLDPESLRDLQTRYFGEMQLVFEEHGGTIEKIIGDAIVAVFGLPQHHPDDPLRGVAAAAESLRTLASLNDQFEQAFGVRLVVRTGIATGEVSVGEVTAGQHVLTGDVLRVATAMEQAAPPNEALLDASTYDLVRDVVQADPMDPVTARGITDPLTAYRLISISDEAEQILRAGEAAEAGTGSGEQVCASCGGDNPAGFARCGTCGASLATVTRAPERRKTVSIVFANPRPATEDGTTPAAEPLRSAMSRYFEVMRSTLERHGGTVEKFIGDAVMAVFGLPVLHEDDALRASRAALEMQATLPPLNEALAAEHGLTIQMQIGVNTGEVIAGDASLGQRLVTGDAVNTAARLEQAASAGEVLIGELTHRLVRDVVRVEPVEPLELKGKADRVPAYRLLSAEKVAAEGFRRRQDAPMVGREREMAALSEILLRARNERAARSASVIADAGTGKSRLIREFVDACDTESIVLRGRCLPYGEGITFWPLVEAARTAAGIEADDSPAIGLVKLRALIHDGAVADRIAAAIGLSSEQFGVPEIFWATRKMLEQLAGDRTAIWVIDDIHWAEQTLLDLIEYLLEQTEAPVLLLCSSRHDILESHPDWGERPDSVRLILKPLSDADAAQIVQNLLGKAGIAGVVRDRIVTAAEGNPLYVEQMLSMLIDSGRVRMVEGKWVPAMDLSEMVVPPTIQALLSARLDLLGHDERTVIEPASVIGQEFALAAVEELVPVAVREAAPTHLDAMSRKQLVRPGQSTNIDEASFRFMHILIKDAAYGGLLKRSRADFHERFAQWADRINRERGRSQEYEEILGYHLEQAFRYLGELGPLDDHGHSVGARASGLLASAGRRAQARGDAPAAANLLRRAAATRSHGDAERLTILLDLAQALRELGEFDEALTVVREAMATARELGQEPMARMARLIQLYIQNFTGETDDGEDWTTAVRTEVEAAIPLFTMLGDERGLLLAWRLRAGMYGVANRYGDLAGALDKVVRYADHLRETRVEAQSAYNMALAMLYGPTPVSEAVPRCEELAEGAISDQSYHALIQTALAQLLAMRGEFDRARTLCREARATLNDLGSRILGATSAIDAARVESLAGDHAAAESVLRATYDELSAVGEKFLLSTVAGLLGRVLVTRGSLDEALALTRQIEEIALPDDVDAQAIWRGVRARVLARRGQGDMAVTLAREAVELRQQSDFLAEQAEALGELAEVQRLAGHAGAAERSRAKAVELLRQKGDVVSQRRLEEELVPEIA